ncbi:MAG: hypothetical protein ACOCYU_01430 [Brevefilum sp.]
MDQSKKLLSFGITGTVSPATPLNRNPTYLLSIHDVQKLLVETAQEPKTRKAIQEALSDADVSLEDLAKSGLLKQAGEHYRISFVLFLKEDLKTIKSVTGDLAHDLAQAYLQQRGEFSSLLARSTNLNNAIDALAYILIGCFSLDWDGLQITSELGYRTESQPTDLGDHYLTWAEERQNEAVRALYWGSHNDYFPECVLTSFGDHCALPRTTFPDLAWRMEHSLYDLNISSEVEYRLVQAFSPFVSDFAELIGELMLSLAEGDRSLEDLAESLGEEPGEILVKVDLLKSLNWVEGNTTSGYRPAIPAIPLSDKDLVEEVLTQSGKILMQWLPEHIDELKDRLSDITPHKYGLTFEETFTQVWHYLFGLTNKHLVKAGFFADPYSPDRQFQGFIPAVWHPDVIPEETTFT